MVLTRNKRSLMRRALYASSLASKVRRISGLVSIIIPLPWAPYLGILSAIPLFHSISLSHTHTLYSTPHPIVITEIIGSKPTFLQLPHTTNNISSHLWVSSARRMLLYHCCASLATMRIPQLNNLSLCGAPLLLASACMPKTALLCSLSFGTFFLVCLLFQLALVGAVFY